MPNVKEFLLGIDGKAYVEYDNATTKIVDLAEVGGGGPTTINNTLTSTATDQALSAAQGKVLQDSKLSYYNSRNSTAAAASGLVIKGVFAGETYTPTVNPNAESILINNWTFFDYAGATSLTGGAGHIVDNLSWFRHSGSGTLSLALAGESKIENTSTGTITTAQAHEGQLSTNIGTIGTYNAMVGSVTGNAGTITTFNAFPVKVGGNTGTIGTVRGLHFPDLSGVSGITTKRAMDNLDPNAPIVSAAPVIDQSLFMSSPSATGFTVTVGDKKQRALITPVADYAAGTINMPAKAGVIEGQKLDVTITKAVTAATWGANGAAFVLNAPSSVTAGQTVSFVYVQAVDWWLCTNKPVVPRSLPGAALGATYTAIEADDGKIWPTPVNVAVTVNTGLPAGFGQGFSGAGVVSFTGTATVTDKRTTGATNPVCSLVNIGTNTYEIWGTKA